VNRTTRKPFRWGGLTGYQELQAIAQELHQVPPGPGSEYLRQLCRPVERVLTKNRALAEDLSQAHLEVERVAACLRYSPRSGGSGKPTGQQIAEEMQVLWQQFQPDRKHQPAQAALQGTWRRLWRTWEPELLPCYDVPGLPPDNLQLESLFSSLRRHQRRISGRKSTQELRDHGHYQVLFGADSEEELLAQLQQVPLAEYEVHCRRLSEAEAPRRFLRHLHHDPAATMKQLVERHVARRAALARTEPRNGPLTDHTI
jgi:hypothetical protein